MGRDRGTARTEARDGLQVNWKHGDSGLRKRSLSASGAGEGHQTWVDGQLETTSVAQPGDFITQGAVGAQLALAEEGFRGEPYVMA